jgi:CarboxypepD_reg-like domain
MELYSDQQKKGSCFECRIFGNARLKQFLQMRNFLLLLVFLGFSFSGLSQTITISGKVIDKETKEALTFASIGIKGKSIGTVTNLQGEFDFHLPNEMRNDFLVVNMLGYKTFDAPIWTLLDTDSLVIEIEKSPFLLNEVVISDTLTGGEILQIALSRIEQNYPMDPYLMYGFYRDLKKVGGTYISLLEAAVKIYDIDYKEPRNKNKLRESVALQEVRRSIGYSSRFTSYFDQDNLLEVLLLHNSVRYRHFPCEQSFFNEISRMKDSYYDGQEIFVITHKGDYDLTVHVEKSTYAIIHIEYDEKVDDKLNKKRGMVSKLVSSKRVNNFKRFEGKYYVNYISLDSKVNWYDKETLELKFETELNQSLLINQVLPNAIGRISSNEKMKAYGLQYQDPPYNKEFWDNYNLIKESPLDRKIIEDLEKQGPLDKQFKDN